MDRMTGPQMQPALLRADEAAKLAAVSKATAYRLMRSDWRSFTIAVGHSRRVVRAALLEWIERQRSGEP